MEKKTKIHEALVIKIVATNFKKVIITALLITMLMAMAFPASATSITGCTTITTPGYYTLDSDIINSGESNCINITANDIILDGQGHTIDGIDAILTNGVYVHNTPGTNVTVKNLTVTDWYYGIYYHSVNRGNITDNTVDSNSWGIYLHESDNHNLKNNNATSNLKDGIKLISHSDHNTLTGNTAHNNGINIGCGITTAGAQHNSITNNTANQNMHGICIYTYSNNNALSNNTANSNSYYGLYIESSSGNSLNHNTMTDNKYDFSVEGIADADFNNNIDITNTVTGKPIIYVKNASNTVYDSTTNAGTFYCIWCDNITVKDLTVSKNKHGTFFWKATNSTIKNINANSNYYGITLANSKYNTLTGNTAKSNRDGIHIAHSSNYNTITDNTANSNDESGIHLYHFNSYNTLTGNTANHNNGIGILLGESCTSNNIADNTVNSNSIGLKLFNYSSYNTLTGNTANSNSYAGVHIEDSKNNTFEGNTIQYNPQGIKFTESDTIVKSNQIHNNLFNNTQNINFGGTTYINTWNTTKTIGTNIIGGTYLAGNYWAHPNGTGFSETCTDNNSDGICDTSYTLETFNIDHLPLTTYTNQISSCTTLGAPGTYYLTADITDSTLGSCINITADNIVFDGQGHTIDGIDTLPPKKGIYVHNPSGMLTNVTVKNLMITDWSDGIHYENVLSGSIENNTASSNNVAIKLTNSNYNTITNNNAHLNGYGIHTYGSNNNTITNNNANTNNYGISLVNSNNNTITNNNANSNSQYGIYIFSPSSSIPIINNQIIGNTVNSNGLYGINLANSNNTNIYNNHLNNTQNINFGGTTYINTWNTTKTIGTNIIGGAYLAGNYWAKPDNTGFSQTCTDSDGDGICDTIYTLATDNIDHLPLTTLAPTPTPTPTPTPSGTPVESDNGTVYFDTDAGNIEQLAAVNVSTIPEAPPTDANLNYGLFRFNVTSIAHGESVTLTLTFPDNLPAGTTYLKYGATPINSTPHWYTIPSTIDGNQITITITDGGLGDDDLTANGIIKDDGGPSIVPSTPTTPIPEFSTMALPISIIIGLILIFIRRSGK